MIHYNHRDWLKILFHWKGSIITKLLPRLFLVFLLGVLASYLYFTWNFKIATIGHTLIAVPLGLLLVFRTSSAHERYWEGADLLYKLIARYENLARQCSAFIEGDPKIVQKDLQLIRSWIDQSYQITLQSLQNPTQPTILHPSEDYHTQSAQRLLMNFKKISDHLLICVKEGRLLEGRMQLIDSTFSNILELWHNMQRIAQTPLPFAYAHHIKTLLTLYCFTLPFALVETMQTLTPLISVVIAFGLFGIEEIGTEIEEPYGTDDNDLPIKECGHELKDTIGFNSAAETIATTPFHFSKQTTDFIHHHRT